MKKLLWIILFLLIPLTSWAATKTITDFTVLSPMDDADEFVVWDIAPGTTKKVTKDVLMSTPGPIGDATSDTGEFSRVGLGLAPDGTAQLKIAYDAAAYTLFTQADGAALTISQISDGTDEIIVKAACNEELSITDAGL